MRPIPGYLLGEILYWFVKFVEEGPPVLWPERPGLVYGLLTVLVAEPYDGEAPGFL